MFIKNGILLLSISFMFMACKTTKDKSLESVNSISWINQLKSDFKKDTLQKHQIIHYQYNNNDVFYVEKCYQCPDAMSYVYDINKKKLCEFGGIIGVNSCKDFNEKAKKIQILYSDL